ncbi:sensor histidine kinase [Meridianimarinicoccus aquatilis]|uniref:histidine kinase n=1 Tax=Meridianimarinicoccus aquatilis TaxID=2552766 RepID=A0A4R6AYU9_9RHOB|nr:sensor histidine kinase [Fluviibacterium aquatile]TDL89440.1 sodium:solute symporter [Fluviibacterium aquatile]
MFGFNVLLEACLAYVALLFVVAFWAERRAKAGRVGWLRSPLVYTLSLSVYCTGWTFYGAVGYAARSGLEYLCIYLGPTLVMAGWWLILRKLVRIARSQRTTSVADLISSRYGKSTFLGGLVTLLAVVGTTPYIALQLQSVTLSFGVFAAQTPEAWPTTNQHASAIWLAVGLAVFTILFGTRNLDANERHHGVVTAIALEALVKLAALLAVGVFVVWHVADGVSDMAQRINASPIAEVKTDGSRWLALTFLSGAALLCLPRMFQVLVVENDDERHLATASWAFPLYLALMSLFVVPIAVMGLEVLPNGSNPDLFVLTLPLALDQDWLSLLAFLGGFSSATSMVIVAAIALSTMVSNHVVMPIWLNLVSGGATVSGDVREVVLLSRRLSIAAVLGLGLMYYRFSGGGEALAAIGLISFVGVVQVLPALLGGIFWRGATRVGAAAGVLIGFALWLYTLFLPSFGPDVVLSAGMLDNGPFGIEWLRPSGLFGLGALDPVVHAVLWSMLLNTSAFVIGSLVSFPKPLERLQGAQIVNVFDYSASRRGWSQGSVEAEDLLVMAQRIVGPGEAQALFQTEAFAQGKEGYLPEITPDFIDLFERRLAGSVGAATAHAMIGQMISGTSVSVQDLMAVADETAQIMEYSSQLENKSKELARTARQLRDANKKLTALSVQKDAFLSQISHELRTPMTSIRAFSEILMSVDDLGVEEKARYSRIIHDEAIRLTRLLDALLDLNVLEHGKVTITPERAVLRDVIDRAVLATSALSDDGQFTIDRIQSEEGVELWTDLDRLSQVFINLMANARKYCDADRPRLRIRVQVAAGQLSVDFVDNGTGIPAESQTLIFEKFSRLSDQSAAGGAGLGLAICREIMTKLGGSVTYLPGQGGAGFRVRLPMGQIEHAA